MFKNSVLDMYNQLKKLPSHGKVGNYPLFYVTSKDEIVCNECAMKLKDDKTVDAVSYDINWDDQKMYCSKDGSHKIENVSNYKAEHKYKED